MPKDTDLGGLMVIETLSRIDTKIDKLDDRLDGMSTTLIRQESSIEEHVRRTNLLEARIEAEAKALVEMLPKEIEAQIKVQRNKFLLTALKVLGIVAGTGGGGMAIKTIISWALQFWK